jgi:hypothetical protein
MSDVATTTANTETAPTNAELPLDDSRWPRQIAVVLALVALADWLFFGHYVGVSAALFLLALAVGVTAANPIAASRNEFLIALGILVAALVLLIVETSILSVLFGVMGTAYFALTTTRTGVRWTERAGHCVSLILDGIWQATADIVTGSQRWAGGEVNSQRLRSLTVWVMPFVLGAVFLGLFVAANPLIEDWIARLNLSSQVQNVSPRRIVFWLAALSLAWPFIFMRNRSKLQENIASELRMTFDEAPKAASTGLLFSEGAIWRSLLVFNAMFAVQTVLDITYLWGGVKLPDGMSYAHYAHRGAYPLVATALLAAAFVVIATRPGSDGERSSLIRPLVFLWVGQNVLLVISSILRLDLYVAMYSLTYLRVAAFVWMLLVAAGLVLIIVRLAQRRSNGWLIVANLATLTLALYVCCFINFPLLVGNYNVDHSRDMGGAGVTLDVSYLVSLGPQALPALGRYIKKGGSDCITTQYKSIICWRDQLSWPHRLRMQDWRAWTWRDAQLERYLDAQAAVPD